MFLNYLKQAIRFLGRNSYFTLINVVGLSIGFATFFMLWPYSQNELMSERFIPDHDRIARFSRTYHFNEGQNQEVVSLPMHSCGIARKLAQENPEIESLTRIIPHQYFETALQGFDEDAFITVQNFDGRKMHYREDGLAYVDQNLFSFFNFPLAKGDPEKVLIAPGSVVISEGIAQKYFGESDPINRILYLNDSIPIKVTGVFKQLPMNTQFNFEVLMTTAGIKDIDLIGWYKQWWGYNYVKFHKDVDYRRFEKKINDNAREIYGTCDRCPSESFTLLLVQPLNEVVFTNLVDNTLRTKSKYLLTMLGVLSFVVLALAWINYICLSINLVYKRMPQIATRIAAGAKGSDLIYQFVVEAALVNLLSIGLALTIVQLTELPINTYLEFYVLEMNEITGTAFLVIGSVICAGVILTGLYPYFILYRRKPVEMLKMSGSLRNPGWLHGIIVLQYTAAIVMLIWIGVVHSQINLIVNKDIGIAKEGIVVMDCPTLKSLQFDTQLSGLLTEIRRLDGVSGVATSKSTAGDPIGYGIPVQLRSNGLEYGLATNGGVDENFLSLYNIQLVAGRNFQPDLPADRNTILLSENALKRLGLPEADSAIGTKLILPWYKQNKATVIGVYKDYELTPFITGLYNSENGSMLTYKNHLIADFYPAKISIKIAGRKFFQVMERVKELYKDAFPEELFSWNFLDEHIQQYYTNEKIARNQITLFTVVAVAISCLGLLGMISNKVIQKTKEIGIRKILGAKLVDIGKLLLSSTFMQIAIASVLGITISLFLTDRYLNNFTYRIALNWWYFIGPIFLLISIMLVSITSSLLRAARANPADSLRHD